MPVAGAVRLLNHGKVCVCRVVGKITFFCCELREFLLTKVIWTALKGHKGPLQFAVRILGGIDCERRAIFVLYFVILDLSVSCLTRI